MKKRLLLLASALPCLIQTEAIIEFVYDECGNRTIMRAQRNPALSDESFEINLDIIAVPNPCHEQVQLTVKTEVKKIQVKLVSLYGNVMLDQEYQTTTFTLDMSRYPSGYYLLYVTAENTNGSCDLIKV